MGTEQAKTKTIQLTSPELENLIAFGNRGTMTGVEADLWVDLKGKLAEAIAAPEPEADGPVKDFNVEAIR